MKGFEDLRHGDKIVCRDDGSVLTATMWRGELYLAEERDMWPAGEFDPADWDKENEKEACI